MQPFREVPDQDAFETPLRGMALLNCPVLNKGTAFSHEEREALGLLGLLPPLESDIESQLQRTYANFLSETTDVERYIYLRALQDRNETLFYRLLREHLVEMMPIIYTPVVGTACLRFSRMFRKPRGLYIPYPRRDSIHAILNNHPYDTVDVIVVTDGERILGLGDQGAGGMGIPIGKLSLYTACGGINPAHTLPILLDTGTDNPQALADPLYVGWRHARIRGQEYDDFIEVFVRAVRRRFPQVVLQWEDFANQHARSILARYRDQLCTFNDDIQGTAAVTLAALLGALRLSGGGLCDQRIVLLGAGSAGLGIADQIVRAMVVEGLSEPQARTRCWILDSKGLIHTERRDLSPAKAPWARKLEELGPDRPLASDHPDLLEVVRRVKPTALIGTTGKPDAFPEAAVREMTRHVERPVIFPLSNPTSLAEARPADLMEWTDGRALVASGSPFGPVSWGGRTITIAQCNNCYIFPGVGLGAIAVGATRITDNMMLAASRALASCASQYAGILPPLDRICEVSREVALAVALQAQQDAVAPQTGEQDARERINRTWWDPRYRVIRPA